MSRPVFLLKTAADGDAQQIHALMRYVYEELEDKSLYVCDDLEFVRTHIAQRGFAVMACTKEGELAAALICRYPMAEKDNLGRELGLSEAELLRIAHMESAVVAPAYRGNGLQCQMIRYAEKIMDAGRFLYFLATVSPDNPASCRSLEKCGYTPVKAAEKYGGLVRRVYCKKAGAVNSANEDPAPMDAGSCFSVSGQELLLSAAPKQQTGQIVDIGAGGAGEN